MGISIIKKGWISKCWKNINHSDFNISNIHGINIITREPTIKILICKTSIPIEGKHGIIKSS